MKRLSACSAVVLGLVLGLGCDGGLTQPPVTDSGKSVWNSSVNLLVVQNLGGGFTPQPPPGSQCLVGAKKFTLTVASRKLDWVRCVGDGKSAYMETTGSRSLSETEFKNLVPLLENLRVVSPDGGCIADASMLTLRVTTPLGTQDYVDDGFQCEVKDRPFIERGALNQTLDRLDTFTVATM